MSESIVVVTAGELEEVAAGYRRYLRFERGLSDATVECYEPRARRFLAQREGPEGLRLGELTAADVCDFLARECPRHGAASAQLLVCVVRSLLRYLYVSGLIPAPLEWAVPSVAALKGRSLPQALEPATVAALLGSCDRRRTVGRRDYAILLLLSRLGLRASEVAGLRLDDVGGGPARSCSAARAVGWTPSRCLSTWARRWRAICDADHRTPTVAGLCS